MANKFMAQAGNSALGNWDDPFGWSEFVAWWGGVAAGDNLYVLNDDTYTAADDIDDATRDGTLAAPISIIGITDLSDVTSEAPDGSQPFWDFTGSAGNSLLLDDYFAVRNMKIKANDIVGALRLDIGGRAVNCDLENTGGGYGLYSGNAYGYYSQCRMKSTGTAAVRGSVGTVIDDCVFYDSAIGVTVNAVYVRLINSLIKGCLVGINVDEDNYFTAIGNTLYHASGTTGVLATDAQVCVFRRNIIYGFTAAANWSSGAELSNFFDWNDYYNGTATTNVTKGPNDQTIDPKFVDAVGGDFRVQAASLLNVGLNPSALGAIQTRFGPRIHPGTSGGARG